MDMCKKCGSSNLYTQNKGPHLGLYCSDCGSHQKWIKQDNATDTGEIATEAQQKYAMSLLRQWKEQSVPLTAKQAGAIIQTFKKG